MTAPDAGTLRETGSTDSGIWNQGPGFAAALEWKPPRTKSTPGSLYSDDPGPHGRVDKNHIYYYRFETPPLTLKDLEDFAIRFREEQGE